MGPPGGWWPLSKDGVLIWDRRGETDTEEEQRREGSGHKARGPWRHRKLGEAGGGGSWSLEPGPAALAVRLWSPELPKNKRPLSRVTLIVSCVTADQGRFHVCLDPAIREAPSA